QIIPRIYMCEVREQTLIAGQQSPTPETILDVQETTCCIVGGGPTGMVLALLLARQGIPVMLLEAHKTFERDFRGDLIQPGAMEIMDELGISDRLLEQVHHSKTGKMEFSLGGQTVTFADVSRLMTRHPYITIIHQVTLIQLL